MLARFGVLLGTLCNERKHRVIKRHTRARLNLTSWSLGSLEEVTCNQIRELKRNFVKTGQLRQSKVTAGTDLKVLLDQHPGLAARDFTLSLQLRGLHGEARVGDVVYYRHQFVDAVGMLCLKYAAKGVEFSVVEAWEFKSSVESDGLQTWTIKPDVIVIPSSAVVIALTYSMPSKHSATCTVIMPNVKVGRFRLK